ncbi:MAG: DUF882 domain-containing protein, partial [Alphaproteobacteria bacterium]|nr:DUF882 domain-containing protein [Alphaproteobacteria bacterium]
MAGFVCLLAMQSETQNAIANGETRTLNLVHAHTQETITATFKVDGQYDAKTLDQLNWFLRDWRLDEPTKMDPRLFDLMWETYRESGSRAPILVQSAYRSPQTNAMLRRRSKAVAENSQHMAGKAMDIHYYDVPMSQIREIGMRLQRGGVGYYPTAGSPFVHLDVGGVRAWPRMSYDQLARLFPDGKTVHLPSNGRPLAKYEEARAEIEARGTGSAPTLAQVKSKGFFAFLFGGGEEEDEDIPVGKVRSAQPRQMASLRSSASPASANLASANLANANSANDDSSAAYYLAEANRRVALQTPVVAKAQTNLPKGETFMGPAATEAPAKPAPIVVAAAQIPPVVASAAPLVSANVTAPPLPKYVDMPLPPQRPAEFMQRAVLPIVTAAFVPLPPIRPPELMPQFLKKPSRTASLELNEALPDVIVKGAEGSQDPAGRSLSALAYAPETQGMGSLM